MENLIINDKKFRSKKELTDYTRNLIKMIGLGIITTDNEHYKFFEELIKRHNEYEIKRGCGIKHFIIRQNRVNRKAYELNIMRLDDTIIDISYIHCCSLINNNELIRAMRYSIRKQILRFKNKSEMICNICNNTSCDFHIDHINPFSLICSQFLKDKLYKPTQFIDCKKTNNPKFKKEDIEFKREWKQFHKQNAKLQVLCSSCNLKKSNKIS